MINRFFIFLFVAIISLQSCKMGNSQTPSQTIQSDSLSVNSLNDTLIGVYVRYNRTDSVFISNDSVNIGINDSTHNLMFIHMTGDSSVEEEISNLNVIDSTNVVGHIVNRNLCGMSGCEIEFNIQPIYISLIFKGQMSGGEYRMTR